MALSWTGPQLRQLLPAPPSTSPHLLSDARPADCTPAAGPAVHARQLRRERRRPGPVAWPLGRRSATTATGAMFHGLREQVDAVLAGTGTLRTERYGRIVARPRAPRRAPRPPAGRPSRWPASCRAAASVPDRHPAVRGARGEGRGVHAPRELETSGCAGAGRGDRARPRAADVDRGVPARCAPTTACASLLCEGGPTVFGALLTRASSTSCSCRSRRSSRAAAMEPAITEGRAARAAAR